MQFARAKMLGEIMMCYAQGKLAGCWAQIRNLKVNYT